MRGRIQTYTGSGTDPECACDNGSAGTLGQRSFYNDIVFGSNEFFDQHFCDFPLIVYLGTTD
jgi:hypothetical protein